MGYCTSGACKIRSQLPQPSWLQVSLSQVCWQLLRGSRKTFGPVECRYLAHAAICFCSLFELARRSPVCDNVLQEASRPLRVASWTWHGALQRSTPS
jgi:hypothetical protein